MIARLSVLSAIIRPFFLRAANAMSLFAFELHYFHLNCLSARAATQRHSAMKGDRREVTLIRDAVILRLINVNWRDYGKRKLSRP